MSNDLHTRTVFRAAGASASKTNPAEDAMRPDWRAVWRRCVLLVSMAGLLAVAGCAVSEQSRRSLAQFRDALQQVDQSAQQFLTDFSNGLKIQETHAALARGVPIIAPEYPAKLKMPAAALPLSDSERNVEATRQALAVVRAYSQALLALAEGQSESEVRMGLGNLGGEIQMLAQLAGATLPALAPVVGIGAKLVKLAQDSANRRELERAVLEGHEPVLQILSGLQQQAPVIYDLSVVGTSQGQTALRDDVRRAAAALRALVQQYGPPSDPALAREAVQIQMEMDRVGRQTGTSAAMPLPLPYASARPAYDAQAQVQAKVFLQSMSSTAQRYGELIAKQNAYHELMQKYVLALLETRLALLKLEESLTRPADLRQESSRLLKVAFDLRDAMAAYRTPAVIP